jgi:hypothetical protein
MRSLRPEGALKALDALDGLAYAVRTICAGYWGERLAATCAGAALTLAVARLVVALA